MRKKEDYEDEEEEQEDEEVDEREEIDEEAEEVEEPEVSEEEMKEEEIEEKKPPVKPKDSRGQLQERKEARAAATAPVPLQQRMDKAKQGQKTPVRPSQPQPRHGALTHPAHAAQEVTAPFQIRIGNRNISMVSKFPLTASASSTRDSAIMTLMATAPSVESMMALLEQEGIHCDEDAQEQLESLALQSRVSRVNISMPTAPTEIEDFHRLRRVDTDDLHAAIIPIRAAQRHV